jgi:hypothetical protein
MQVLGSLSHMERLGRSLAHFTLPYMGHLIHALPSVKGEFVDLMVNVC